MSYDSGEKLEQLPTLAHQEATQYSINANKYILDLLVAHGLVPAAWESLPGPGGTGCFDHPVHVQNI